MATKKAHAWTPLVFEVDSDDLAKHLNTAQLELFIAMMGENVDDYEIDARKPREPQLALIIFELIGKDTVRGQAAYDVICRNKLPAGVPPAPTGTFSQAQYWDAAEKIMRSVTAEAVGPFITDLKVQAQGARREVQEAIAVETRGLSARLEDVARETAKKVAGEYRVVAVQQGNEKPRKLDGTMHAQFERVLKLASLRINIALVGPAGCGKTYMAAQVAKALKLDYAAQSMSAGVSESAFNGWLLPVGKGGEYMHVPAPFLDIYENGGVFLFDEADNADANMLVFLNMALGNTEFYLPQRRGKTRVVKHKNFVAMAAMNTYGHGADMVYAGRAQLDGATLDRFRIGMVTMDYDTVMESKLVRPELCGWAYEVRKVINANKLRRTLSTRALIDAEKLMGAGDTRAQATGGFWQDWSPDERRLVSAHLF